MQLGEYKGGPSSRETNMPGLHKAGKPTWKVQGGKANFFSGQLGEVKKGCEQTLREQFAGQAFAKTSIHK